MTIILDTGALIAIDRGRRDLLSHLQAASAGGDRIRVPAAVIGKVWRDPGRQVLLTRALGQCDEIALDGAAARLAGQLCGRSGTADVIDASVAVAAAESAGQGGDMVLLTSDSDGMRTLISAINSRTQIVEV